MPQYGKIIARLRKENNMTQAEMGARLNVTFQAVSKWENDQSQPDFATMNEIAKLFHVPLTVFLEEDESADEAAAAAPSAEEGPKKEEETAIGYCSVCGNAVYESTLGQQHPELLCRECVASFRRNQAEARRRAEEEAKRRQMEAERKAKQAQARAEFLREEARRKRNKGLIWGGVIGGILLLIFLISVISSSQGQLWEGILGSVLIAVFGFAFTAQMIWGGFVRSTFSYGGAIIGTPGVIFTLDLDGILFLIGVKLLFAVIRFIVYLLTTLFFACVAFICSPFTFVPALIRMNRAGA